MASKLKWFPVNIDGFKGETAKAFKEYEAQRAKTLTARQNLEKRMAVTAAKKAPKGTVPIFSYRFGKIAVAFQPEEEHKPAATSAGAIDL